MMIIIVSNRSVFVPFVVVVVVLSVQPPQQLRYILIDTSKSISICRAEILSASQPVNCSNWCRWCCCFELTQQHAPLPSRSVEFDQQEKENGLHHLVVAAIKVASATPAKIARSCCAHFCRCIGDAQAKIAVKCCQRVCLHPTGRFCALVVQLQLLLRPRVFFLADCR